MNGVTLIECPSCRGARLEPMETLAHACRPIKARLPCFQCDGAGRLSAKAPEWIARGRMLKDLRLAAAMGLRQAAELWGIHAAELSDIEHGRIDNTRWRSPLEPDPREQYAEECRILAERIGAVRRWRKTWRTFRMFLLAYWRLWLALNAIGERHQHLSPYD